jgi:Flp pilus assembly protein TadD
LAAEATPDLLSRAREQVRAGDHAGAERLCREALETDPDSADARGLLGAECLFMGRLAEAAEHLEKAVHLDPRFAAAHANLGIVRTAQEKLEEAAAHFRQALSINPLDSRTLVRLADILHKQGRLEDAAAAFRRAASLAPGQGRAHFGLGMTLVRLGRFQEAEASYRQALRLGPDSVETMVNLGNVLVERGDLEGAIDLLHQAVALRPDFTQAHINLAHALMRLGRYAEAAARYGEALRLHPGSADVLDSLGTLRMKEGRLGEAMEHFEKAVSLKPDHADARLHRALGWLIAGDFERGWPEFEWRWRSRGFQERRLPRPRWDGSSPAGRTILLYAEQGFGDTFQFVRYAPLLKERGARVIVECQEPLVRILRGCPGIDRIVPRGEPLPEYDVQAPFLSLPGLLRTTLDTVPANVPYLEADPGLVERWRQELSGVEGRKIGVAWQGNPKYSADRQRSIPLLRIAPLARLPAVRLVSLQKMHGIDQIAAVSGDFSVIDFGSRLDDANGAFMDTAALMKSLDLVVTSDTAIPHLAGALGVPVWLALPKVADFRYLLRREDSPWYPTMRLFRQTEAGNWDEVFERMARELS